MNNTEERKVTTMKDLEEKVTKLREIVDWAEESTQIFRAKAPYWVNSFRYSARDVGAMINALQDTVRKVEKKLEEIYWTEIPHLVSLAEGKTVELFLNEDIIPSAEAFAYVYDLTPEGDVNEFRIRTWYELKAKRMGSSRDVKIYNKTMSFDEFMEIWVEGKEERIRDVYDSLFAVVEDKHQRK